MTRDNQGSRIAIRVESSNENALLAIQRALKNKENIRVTDITYDTARQVILHARREEEIFRIVADRGEITVGKLHAALSKTAATCSYKTVQRDVGSLSLRGLLVTRRKNGYGGNKTLVSLP